MTGRFLNKLTQCASRRHLVVLAAACLGVAAACSPDAARSSSGNAGTAAATADSAARQSADSAAAMAAVRDTALARRLSPAAESIAPYLVFTPAEERQFVAAVRNKRWLLDEGRIDVDVRKDSAKLRAFREAAAMWSPVPPRGILRLWWAKGAEDVVVDSFAVHNGRIVRRVLGSAALDSAARGPGNFVALAVRADSATAPLPTTCELRLDPDSAAVVALASLTPAERRARTTALKSADSAYAARVTAVRDSLESVLRLERPPYERLQRRMKLVWSQARGCFGDARRALVVSLRAGDAEWVRERLVLITPNGTVSALRVDDGRFRAHDLLTAFDADGDGVDDLAARGTTLRAGGTSILRIDLAKKRAERLAAGFAWEVF